MDDMEFVRKEVAKAENLTTVALEADVGYSWLKMFARGEIPDPSYSRIKALADYFRGETAKH